MIRWLGIILVLAMLLCGCAAQTAPTTDPTNDALQTTDPTQPQGIYQPNSAIEMATGGSVQCFVPEGNGYYGCAMIGRELLLLRQENGTAELSLYEGNRLECVKRVTLSDGVAPAMEQIQISQRGIGYYDDVNRAMVFLNADLREVGRMSLQEEFTGDAWLSPSWQMVYFCKENGIYAMDLQTSIIRLLREQEGLTITGVFGDGEALRCEEVIQDQKQITLISTETGEVLYQGEELLGLQTQGDAYMLPLKMEQTAYLRYGASGKHQLLWPAENEGTPVALFPDDAVMVLCEQNGALTLNYYSMQTGNRQAMVSIAGMPHLWGFCGDGNGGVWLFGQDEAGKEQLLHWVPIKTPLMDLGIYTTPYYSPENPDLEGLEQLKQSLQASLDRVGAELLLWQDAVSVAPKGYTFIGEHMSQHYQMHLTMLEKALQAFPDGFFEDENGVKLQIALVKKIAGNVQWGNLPEMDVLQFWNGNVPVMALTLQQGMEQSFYRGIYHYIDTHALSKSRALYEWNKLNPKGFAYDNSYITNLDRVDTTYTEGNNRYFIDLLSMSYAKEDRGQIFAYACMEGNEEYFRAPVIQEKLKRISKGIREAFGLKDVEDAFLWEQYIIK